MALQTHNMNLTEPLAPNAEWVHESSAQVGYSFFSTLIIFHNVIDRLTRRSQ
jgi:hypothetical protein